MAGRTGSGRGLDRDGHLVLGTTHRVSCRRGGAGGWARCFPRRGDAASAEFRQEPGCRRLANLADKGAAFRNVLAHPRVLERARHVLGPDLKLSSLNARSADPGGGARPLDADLVALPDAKGSWVCNTIRMLDACTQDDGAIGLVPGSHRRGRPPPQAPADPLADRPGQVLVTGRAGTVVVPNAHARHACTAHRAGRPRAAPHAFSCRRDRPRQQDQRWLLRPEVQRRLPPGLRELLALDDPLNGRLSSGGAAAVCSGFLK
jgi:hypothetical protein